MGPNPRPGPWALSLWPWKKGGRHKVWAWDLVLALALQSHSENKGKQQHQRDWLDLLVSYFQTGHASKLHYAAIEARRTAHKHALCCKSLHDCCVRQLLTLRYLRLLQRMRANNSINEWLTGASRFISSNQPYLKATRCCHWSMQNCSQTIVLLQQFAWLLRQTTIGLEVLADLTSRNFSFCGCITILKWNNMLENAAMFSFFRRRTVIERANDQTNNNWKSEISWRYMPWWFLQVRLTFSNGYPATPASPTSQDYEKSWQHQFAVHRLSSLEIC